MNLDETRNEVKTTNLPVTLKDDLRDRLQIIADHYYDGNLSMAVRATIKRGLPFLEGEIPEDKGSRRDGDSQKDKSQL